MSIEITREKCIGCGQCASVCPGSLIRISGGKAFIPRPESCWGCTSCLKECPTQAIALYLAEDVGGLGGRLTVRSENRLLHWMVKMPDGEKVTITLDSRNANKY